MRARIAPRPSSGSSPGILRGLRLRLAASLLLLAALVPVVAVAQDDDAGRRAGPAPGTPIPLFVDGQQIARLAVGDLLSFVVADDQAEAATTLPVDRVVLLELTVQNVSATPFRFDLAAIALVDDAGASYRALPNLQIAAAMSDDDSGVLDRKA